MQIGYVIREGFSGFKRAKLAMVAAIVTICISLLLLSFVAILLINANSVVESLREKVEMEAFISDHLTPDEVIVLSKKVEAVEGVRQALYISKEDAAKIFKEEFGEDIHKVLDFNPLPASFKILLQTKYRTASGAAAVYDQISTLPGVEEVIYRKSLLEMLDKRATTLLWIILGIAIFITISSVFLVANTIRLAIYAKRKIIQTMKLIGATRMFIRVPFVLEGLIQGFFGGCIAALLIYLIFEYLEKWFSIALSEFVKVQTSYYGIIIGLGCLLGLIGSIISIRRFIGEGLASE